MDLKQYWHDVRGVMDKLPPSEMYFLISISNPDKGTTAGQVFAIADPKQAARRIVERTHVMASPADIERFHANQERQDQELAEMEYARKQQMGMPKEVQDLIKLAAASVRQDPAQPPRQAKEK